MKIRWHAMIKDFLISLSIALYIFFAFSPHYCFGIEAKAGDGEINLTWVAPTKNEDGTLLTDLAGYYVYKSQDTGEPFQRVNNEPLRAIYFTDTGLTNGISYFYAVTAVDFSGNESKQSPSISAVPNIQPPSKLRAKPGDGKVNLFWETYTVSAIRGYHVYKRGTMEQEYKRITELPCENPAFEDSMVSNGIAYFYKVSCVGTEGIEGLSSEEVGVTPMAIIPGEPSGVKARYVKIPEGTGYIELNWEKSQETDIIGYKIYRRLLAEREFYTLTPDPVQETTYRDTTIQPERGYLYSVVAITEGGAESTYPKEAQCMTSALYISSFSSDTQDKAKKGGDTICFCLRGEPDRNAYYSIEGLSVSYIPMEEIGEGVYKGCLTVTQEMSLVNGKALGILKDPQGNETLFSAEESLVIDNQSPDPVKGARAEWEAGSIVITWEPPQEGEYEGFEILRQEEGLTKGGEGEKYTSVLPVDAKRFLDGVIKPDTTYRYTISVLDRAGNISLPFSLPSIHVPYQEGVPSIKEVQENTRGFPQNTNDRIEVKLIGEKGCKATLLIPEVIPTAILMTEAQPGVYTGWYIIQPGDTSPQTLLKVCLKDDLGNANCQTVISNLRINSIPTDTTPPQIRSIQHNAFKIAGFSRHLVPGNMLEVILSAEAGGKAFFMIMPNDQSPEPPAKTTESDLEKKFVTYTISERQDSPGEYTGSCQISWTDRSMDEAYVWVCMSDWAGNKVWQKAEESFSIDTRPRIKVIPEKNALWCDQESLTRLTVMVMDANEDPVFGHPIALTLTTTDEYTGTIGGGDFGRKIDGSTGIDFDQKTDSWGEITTEYTAGFAAKTALIVAKDMETGHAGAGYILNILKAQTDIILETPPSLSRFLKASPYKLILYADPDRLTADGMSSAWITAQLAEENGKRVEKEGVRVSFYLEGRNGDLSPSQSETDGSGEAHIRYTAGIIRGTVIITAISISEDVYNGSTGEVKIALMSDAPAKMELMADPNRLIANGENQSRIKVWVADINNNAVQEAMVEFSILQESRGTLSAVTMATDFNGRAGCTYTTPQITGHTPTIATIVSTITSKVPEEHELEMALGTIFIPILSPDMREDDEVKVIEWLYRKGEEVKEGSPIVRLQTEKGEAYLNAPVSGELVNIRVNKGEKAQSGQSIGNIRADEDYLD